jgi:hypothetical protein
MLINPKTFPYSYQRYSFNGDYSSLLPSSFNSLKYLFCANRKATLVKKFYKSTYAMAGVVRVGADIPEELWVRMKKLVTGRRFLKLSERLWRDMWMWSIIMYVYEETRLRSW